MSSRTPQEYLEEKIIGDHGLFEFAGNVEVQFESNIKCSELLKIKSSRHFKDYASEGKELASRFDRATKSWEVYTRSEPKDASTISDSVLRLAQHAHLVDVQNDRFLAFVAGGVASALYGLSEACFELHDKCYKRFESLAKDMVKLEAHIATAKKLVDDAETYAALKGIGDAVSIFISASSPLGKALIIVGKAAYDELIDDAFGGNNTEMDRLMRHLEQFRSGAKQAVAFAMPKLDDEGKKFEKVMEKIEKTTKAVGTLAKNVNKVAKAQKILAEISKQFVLVQKEYHRTKTTLERITNDLDRASGNAVAATTAFRRVDAKFKEDSRLYKELKATIKEAGQAA